MKKILIVVGIIFIALVIYALGKPAYTYIKVRQITTFEACVKAGYKVNVYLNTTDPSKCTLPDGRELFDKVYGPNN